MHGLVSICYTVYKFWHSRIQTIHCTLLNKKEWYSIIIYLVKFSYILTWSIYPSLSSEKPKYLDSWVWNRTKPEVRQKDVLFPKKSTSGWMKLDQHDLWAARRAPAIFPPTGKGKARKFLPESKDAFMAKDAWDRRWVPLFSDPQIK